MRYAEKSVIELDGVGKSYGAVQVLEDLELSLPAGVHALLGPNGAGKTTVVNVLTTLVTQDRGAARVLGYDTVADAAQVRRRISVAGQFTSVDDVLTGAENLVMMGRLLGLTTGGARKRADELLDAFDLIDAGGRRVGTYSGGMRRRLDLAVSLIWPPGVLFLDEPTTGLDTRSRLALWDQIRDLSTHGTTVFLTTQYLEEADQLADRIALLDGGRIVADGTAAELKGRIGGEVLRVQDRAGTVVREIPTDGSAGSLARAAADVAADTPDLQVTLYRPTLDDVFLELTGRRPAALAETEPAR